MDGNLITVRTFNYRHEAEMARTALEANGIPAIVFSDDGGRQEVSLQFVRGAQLMVNKEDEQRAKEILRSADRRGPRLAEDSG
jgi:Putative prokaryotic signal transducing protein